MKKKIDIVYIVFSLISVLLLFMYKYTGMVSHVAIATFLCAVTIVHTLFTHRSWKSRPEEITLRLLLTLTFLTGFPAASFRLQTLIIIHKILSVILTVYLVICAIRRFTRKTKDM